MRKSTILIGLAASLVIANPTPLAAAPREVMLSENNIFPENIAALPNGTLFVGSLIQPFISRALPGESEARPWIRFSGDQIGTTLGVFADPASNTLWACVIEHPATTPQPPPSGTRHTSLRSFDLQSGTLRTRYPLPGEFNSCNDIAVMPDGAVYVSDPPNGRVLRLKPGAAQIEQWIKDDRLAGVDGITVMRGTLYVNSISAGRVYRIPIGADGAAGAPVEIALPRTLAGPDGMRAAGSRMFVAEARGMMVSELIIDGDRATIATIGTGYANPASVQPTADTLWIGESKQNYWRDPALQGKDPNPFRIIAVPLHPRPDS